MRLDQIAAGIAADLPHGSREVLVQRVTIDSRDVRPGDLFVAIRGDRFDGHDFLREALLRGAVGCVCSRDWFETRREPISRPCLVVEDTVEALSRLAGFYRREVMSARTVVVAITGSNGKTTTKYMLDHVLSASLRGRAAPKNFNNHIGVPLTLLSSKAQDQFLLVEIGANAPGEVGSLAAMASPDVGVITSIGEAHLEGFTNVEGVAAEKVSLLTHVRPHGFAVVNVDRGEIRPLLGGGCKVRVIRIGFDRAAQLRVRCVGRSIRHSSVEIDGRFRVELPMPGAHHATNAAVTFAIARWFGMAPETIVERLATFVPPEGRTRVLDAGGVTIVDDTYNANPASMAAAVETLARAGSGRRVFVMGDMWELGTATEGLHRQLVKMVMDAGIELLVAVGSATGEAVRAWDHPSSATRVICCEDATEAEDVLRGLLRPRDTIWLKGSRANELDRLVKALCRFSAPRVEVA